MKKLSKLRLKKKQPEEPAGRITTDTLAEHRQQVLAGGRKFKYPVQYARHKLVVNAIIIIIATVIILLGVGYWLLYQAQNTSDFMYRVTKVVPVPVAEVDGQQVRYSEYLMKFRSNLHYLVEKEQVDVTTEDGQRQVEFIKDQAMHDAIADAFANKIAKDKDLKVTDAELETYLKQQRQSSDGNEVSESTYNAVILDYYGWSPDEYQQAMKTKLLRQKVAYAVDQDAETVSKKVEASIAAGTVDLNVVATTINVDEQKSVIFWPAAWVPLDNQDGGLAAAALKLEIGQVSKAVKTTSGDGYYYVKLVDKNETQVRYEYLQVPLSAFDDLLADAETDKKTTQYISIPVIDEQTEPTKQ
ncbi:MAG: Peptidylprolyl isomerase [Candidatus Saccharibacteria bacterium]|nr:Peptidylprolyl isomerase [Candidatus Saccharibacteria bacterium]